jgi:adenylate cyclase
MWEKSWAKLLFPENRPLRWVVPVFVLMLIIMLQAAFPAWSDFFEGPTIDLRFWLCGPEEPQSPVIIIAADEDSFHMLGDLRGENIRMWPRQRWAELINVIASGRPRVIGIDIAFDTPGWDIDGDQSLANALATAPPVVLAAHFQETPTIQGIIRSYRPPQAQLEQEASAAGVVDLVADSDGVYRRTTLLWPWAGGQAASFPLAIATLYHGQPITIPREHLDKTLSLNVNYRGKANTFETIPLYRVLQEDFATEIFNDKIILIGYTTLVEQDRHPTPFANQEKMPGVEIHANAVDTLLSGDWLLRPPGVVTFLLVALGGLLALLLTSLPRPNLGLAALTGLILFYMAVTVTIFNAANFLLPLIAPLLAALLVGGASTAERMVFSERDKRLLHQRFSGMMSPERLQSLLDNWKDLLDSNRPERQASVLFCDIRGFTQATESLMHQGRSPEMVKFLNTYLAEMEAAIFAESGVIYRTFGDGLLVLFGLPQPLPNHARHAVRATIRMAKAAEKLKPYWPLQDQVPFEIGIGLNCGPMVDAIIGSHRRFDYTVLGDSVNTAARIESHCKVVMQIPRPPGDWDVPAEVTILLGNDLITQVHEIVVTDENIPPFQAHGKSNPLHVARLLGLKESEVL